MQWPMPAISCSKDRREFLRLRSRCLRHEDLVETRRPFIQDRPSGGRDLLAQPIPDAIQQHGPVAPASPPGHTTAAHGHRLKFPLKTHHKFDAVLLDILETPT